MRIGKIPVNVLKRSILRELHNPKGNEVIRGAEVGADNALLRLNMRETAVMNTQSYQAHSECFAAMAVYRAVNNLVCDGAKPIAVTVAFTLPKQFSEQRLKSYMQAITKVAAECNIDIVGGDTKIFGGVTAPVVTVTGIGRVCHNKNMNSRKVTAGQELVVSKWIGMEGAVLLAKEKEEELRQRYPYAMMEVVKGLDRGLSVCAEAYFAAEAGAGGLHDLSEGGILGGLWEFAEHYRVGLEVELKKIPVKQEIIEICEYFELNPYALCSGGSLLMAVDEGDMLVQKLQEMGIRASVIGKVTKSNDRVIYNGDEKRYLDRPQADEIYKVCFSNSK